MKTIGLVGEINNDKEAIRNLLAQKFSKDVKFKTLLNNFEGSDLDSKAFKKYLKSELEANPLGNVIFIKDLDAIQSDSGKIKDIKKWFVEVNKLSGNIGVLLMNIYELEALIFADIDIYNGIYKTNIKGNKDVHFIHDPKGELKRARRKGNKKYKELDCPDLFKKQRYDVIKANSILFRDFEKNFIKLRK